MNFKSILISILVIFLTSTIASAQTDINVVVGGGFGGIAYKNSEGLGISKEERVNGFGFNHMAEWYFSEILGIGLRQTAFIASNDLEINEADYSETTTVSSLMMTLHLILFGSDSWARFGITSGYGRSAYRYQLDTDEDESENADDEEYTGSGDAYLVGAFLDWGGDGFGMRFGYDYFQTDFDTFDTEVNETETRDVDLSGTGDYVYLNFRYAW